MKPRFWIAAAAALALLGAACGKSAEEAELERLRRENEALRARMEQQGAPATPSGVARHFANDAGAGTLAGLMPGYDIAVARERFGAEATVRTWRSEGRPVNNHEWTLENGVSLRVTAADTGRVTRVAVVLAEPTRVNIPTLYGIVLGRETFAGLAQRWGSALTADPQFWGAQGLYTVAQRIQFEGQGRMLEFVYEMPPQVNRAELERLGAELQRSRDPQLVMPYLRDAAPFMVALEEVR